MGRHNLEEITRYVEKDFSLSDIENGIQKFKKCLDKLQQIELEVPLFRSQKVENFVFLIRKTILEVYGEQSFEYQKNKNYQIFQPYYNIMYDTSSENQQKFIEKMPECRVFLENFIELLEDKRNEADTSTPQKEESEPLDFWLILHPKVVQIAKTRFDARNYADAVEAVFKEINSVLKNEYRRRKGLELDGSDLMMKAFKSNLNSDPPDWPVISLNGLNSESDRNIQDGYQFIFAGAMKAIRNPKAHENLIIDKNSCMHFLMFGSLLFYTLKESGIVIP